MRQIVFMILALLTLCGCGYEVNTPEGKKYMSLNEALAVANSLETYHDLEMQAGLWDADYYLIRKKRREFYVRSHPEISQESKESILKGQIAIGMIKEQVLASWGWPHRVNRTVGRWGTDEQWIYGNMLSDPTTFLYFENDKLISWQD